MRIAGFESDSAGKRYGLGKGALILRRIKSACAAVKPHKGNVAASSKDTEDGILMLRSASKIAYSANPPGRGSLDVAEGPRK